LGNGIENVLTKVLTTKVSTNLHTFPSLRLLHLKDCQTNAFH